MQHTMLIIPESNQIVIVGGEEQSGNLLDSCEIYSF